MKGNETAPGFIFLALKAIFQKMSMDANQLTDIRCSYIEVVHVASFRCY